MEWGGAWTLEAAKESILLLQGSKRVDSIALKLLEALQTHTNTAFAQCLTSRPLSVAFTSRSPTKSNQIKNHKAVVTQKDYKAMLVFLQGSWPWAPTFTGHRSIGSDVGRGKTDERTKVKRWKRPKPNSLVLHLL